MAHLKYCVHGIHEKQVFVRLVVDSFAYCLGQLGLFKISLYSWWILPCLNKELFYFIQHIKNSVEGFHPPPTPLYHSGGMNLRVRLRVKFSSIY